MKPEQNIYFVLDERGEDHFPEDDMEEWENLCDEPEYRLYFYATLDEAIASRENILQMATGGPYGNVADVIKIYKTTFGENAPLKKIFLKKQPIKLS